MSSSPRTDLFFFPFPCHTACALFISFSSSCLPCAIFVINFQCRALHSSPHWQKNPLHTWSHHCHSLCVTHAIPWFFRLNGLDGAQVLSVEIVSLTKLWLQLLDGKIGPFSLFRLLLLMFRKTFVSAEGRIHHYEMPRFVSTGLRGLWFWPFHLCCLDCFWITMYSLFSFQQSCGFLQLSKFWCTLCNNFCFFFDWVLISSDVAVPNTDQVVTQCFLWFNILIFPGDFTVSPVFLIYTG